MFSVVRISKDLLSMNGTREQLKGIQEEQGFCGLNEKIINLQIKSLSNKSIYY